MMQVPTSWIYALKVEFHELGQAYQFPKLTEERESDVNLLYVPALREGFGYSILLRMSSNTGIDIRQLQLYASQPGAHRTQRHRPDLAESELLDNPALFIRMRASE